MSGGAHARIRWISGPVLRARTEGSFLLREAIRVGPDELLGEVIRVQENEIVAHRAGKVEELNVVEGASVSSGDVLAVIK